MMRIEVVHEKTIEEFKKKVNNLNNAYDVHYTQTHYQCVNDLNNYVAYLFIQEQDDKKEPIKEITLNPHGLNKGGAWYNKNGSLYVKLGDGTKENNVKINKDNTINIKEETYTLERNIYKQEGDRRPDYNLIGE